MHTQVIKDKTIHYFFFIFFLFCFFLLFSRGMYLHPDSNGYINHSLTREPGYCILIILAKFFCHNSYQSLLGIFQILFACFSAFYLCWISSKTFHIHGFWLIILYGIIAIYYDLFSVIFPHWGQSMILTILAEAITYPLFLLYIAFAIKALVYKSFKNWMFANLICSTLFFIRHSSSYLFIVQILCLIYLFYGNVKKILQSVGIILLLVVVVLSSEMLYFKSLSGTYTTRTFVPVNTMLNFLLLVDEEDLSLYQNDITREIFAKTYEEMQSQGYILSQERLSESPIQRAKYISKVHDYVMFDIYQPIFDQYFEEHNIMSPLDKAKIEDQVSIEIYQPLVKKHFNQWIKGYVGIVLLSFHASACAIAPSHWIMYVISILVYAIAIVLAFLTRKNKDAILLSFLVFFLTCGCVFSTALFMPSVQRLVIYNFPAIYLLIIALLRIQRTHSLE